MYYVFSAHFGAHFDAGYPIDPTVSQPKIHFIQAYYTKVIP